jgi:hypothetical protein
MPKYRLNQDVLVNTDTSKLLYKGKCEPVVSEGDYIYHRQRSYYKTESEQYFVLTQEYRPKGLIEFFLSETFHNYIPKTLFEEYATSLTAQQCANMLISEEGRSPDSVKEIFSFQTA